MADDRKTGPVPDDWDSLPLDPTADDDWDEAPPEAASSPDLPADGDWDAGQDGLAELEGALSLASPAADDDWDEEPAPTDHLDNPDDDDWDEAPSEAASPLPKAEPMPKEEPNVPSEAEDFDFPPPELFDAFPEEKAGDEREQAAVPEAPVPDGADPESDLLSHLASGVALPKKVELDLEDDFLEDLASQVSGTANQPSEPSEEPAPEPEEPAPSEEEPVPPEEPAEPEPLAVRLRKIPKPLLLAALALLLLVLTGLGWGVHRLFFHSPPPRILVINPAVPQRDPEPGEVLLRPFYINFAGEPEAIVEMSVQLYYNDLPDRELIETNLPVVREAIFRLTRIKGSQVVTSGEMQRALRQELIRAANEALGAEAVSYVQFTQFRILR
ncbi:MAG: flagellar basal body-associated FliL family protein [Deltaproteobacteria bacterium]|nr:flagellar basal body-associated FliL family protein [Deltaproteobacteria bacterium]